MFQDLFLAAAVGLGSASAMTLTEFPFWKKWGMTGVAEWQMNWVIVSRLRGISSRNRQPEIPFVIASHLSHGVAASIVFSILLPLSFSVFPAAKLSIPLDALLYSLLLWVIFSVMLRTTFEVLGRIEISTRGTLVALLSHVVYGVLLGLFVSVQPLI